mmetsp:Transcript_13159/g.18213  ORF Transcript_13159/g.18213 Transcript_13159/m.18213 type:complete len:94 (-) Transcript_13159:375-656(-)
MRKHLEKKGTETVPFDSLVLFEGFEFFVKLRIFVVHCFANLALHMTQVLWDHHFHTKESHNRTWTVGTGLCLLLSEVPEGYKWRVDLASGIEK